MTAESTRSWMLDVPHTRDSRWPALILARGRSPRLFRYGPSSLGLVCRPSNPLVTVKKRRAGRVPFRLPTIDRLGLENGARTSSMPVDAQTISSLWFWRSLSLCLLS